MIRTEELMLGDWVLSIHPAVPRPIKVTEIGKNDIGYKNGILSISFIEPVPITPKILEKNGFKLKEENDSYKKYIAVDEHCIIVFYFYKETIYGVSTLLECERDFVGGLDRIHKCNLLYVHQLQNAFNLCRMPPTIEL